MGLGDGKATKESKEVTKELGYILDAVSTLGDQLINSFQDAVLTTRLTELNYYQRSILDSNLTHLERECPLLLSSKRTMRMDTTRDF